MGHTNGVNHVVLQSDKIISCSRDKTVRVWSLESKTEIAKIEGGHKDFVISVRTSQGSVSCFVLSSCVTCLARRFLVSYAFNFKAGDDCDCHAMTQVAVVPDGTKVVTASGDRDICVWEL